MKKSVVIAMILTIVVVSPVIVGYVLPSGEATDTSYKSDKFMNITNEISTDSIPIYNRYTGELNNVGCWSNQADVFDPFDEDLTPVKKSNSPNAYPLLKNEGTKELSKTPQPVTGQFRPCYKEKVEAGMRGYFTSEETGDTWIGLIFIYNNGRIDAYNSNEKVLTENVHNVILHAAKSNSTGLPFDTVDIYSTTFNINGYADPSTGWNADPNHAWRSLNGANTVDVILKFGDLDTMITIGERMGNYRIWSMDIWAINGTIKATLFTYTGDSSNTPIEKAKATIGSVHAYSYLLLKMHKDNSLSISLSGLIGMNDFTAEYRDKVGNTENFQLDNIYSSQAVGSPIGFEIFYSNKASISIASSDILSGYSWGITDKTVTPEDYLGHKGDFLITLNNVAVSGDLIGFNKKYSGSNSSYTQWLTIKNGGVMYGEQLYLLNGLEIMSISEGPDAGLWINKTHVSSDVGVGIILDDNWICQVTVSEVTPITVKNYVWDAGSFNLDYDGFCKIGLIASALSFIVTGLAGRRDGGSAAVAAIASAICGIVYMILLMH